MKKYKKTAWKIEQERIAQQKYLLGVQPKATLIETIDYLLQGLLNFWR